MIVTIFRSRLDPRHEAEYGAWAQRIHALAVTMPGFVSIKTYQADDGERVSVVEFATPEAPAAWREHPEHLTVQRLGRERFYTEFRIQVCEVRTAYGWPPAGTTG